MEQKETKRTRCRYSFVSLDQPVDGSSCSYNCHRNGLKNVLHNISEKDCEDCQLFKSKYIEFPITINSLDIQQFEYNTAIGHQIGEMVKVRPCGKEYNGKTYVGIFLGDMPMSTQVSFNDKTQVMTVRPMYNPAIFIPKINKVIFGAQCWWSKMKDENDVADITDDMIDNQWYVQLLKSMSETRKGANDDTE